MPKRSPAPALELLFSDAMAPRAQAAIVLPHLPGADVEPLATALLESPPVGRRRVLPAPSLAMPAPELRAWHNDALMAMSEDDRLSLSVATGPTAGYLVPFMGADVVATAVIRGPLAASSAAQRPKRLKNRVLLALERGDTRSQNRLRPWANPQSRALLAPWHDAEGLPVSFGPPDDADRWRQLLFEDVLPHLQLVVADEAVALARELARRLGCRPKRAVRAAESLVMVSASRSAPADARYADLLRSLNWLDMELYERGGSSHF